MNVKVKLSHRLIIRTLGREDVWESKRISTLDNTDVSPLQTFAAMLLTLRRLMSYIYGAPILDVSRSHTTTQHSR